jgi:hypothetical protein
VDELAGVPEEHDQRKNRLRRQGDETVLAVKELLALVDRAARRR